MLIGTKKGEALKAIEFAIQEEKNDPMDALAFLRAWFEGDGEALQEWPEWFEFIKDLPEVMDIMLQS